VARHKIAGKMICGLLIPCIYLMVTVCQAFAGGVGTDELLQQIKELKETVELQERKIEALERRVIQQEEASRRAEMNVAVSEIDKRIDQRLKKQEGILQTLDGLKVGFEATTIVQGVRNANGPDQLSAREDETDASMTAKVSFEKSFEDYGTAFIQFKSAPGSGVDRALQLYGNVNNNACDKSEVYMSEAWYEHYFKPFNITLTFGKLDATNYIDTNEYANLDTSQFLALIFGNSPVIEFPSSNGAGARMAIAPTGMLDAEFLAMDSKADWNNVFDALFLACQFN